MCEKFLVTGKYLRSVNLIESEKLLPKLMTKPSFRTENMVIRECYARMPNVFEIVEIVFPIFIPSQCCMKGRMNMDLRKFIENPLITECPKHQVGEHFAT